MGSLRPGLLLRQPRMLNQAFPAPKLQAPKNPVVKAPSTPLAVPAPSAPQSTTAMRPMPAVRGALSFGNIAYPGAKPQKPLKVQIPSPQKVNPLL